MKHLSVVERGPKAALPAALAVALLAAAPLAWYSLDRPGGGMPVQWTEWELQFEEGAGMEPEWAVQSVWAQETFEETKLYLRVENTTDHYVRDGFFYAEMLDDRERFCFSALFSLRENLEEERGPLKPGGEHTLFSRSDGLGPAVRPHVIRVYPAHRQPQGLGKAFAAAVPIRVPVQIRPSSISVPTPDWATLHLPPPRGRYDTPVVDLALAAADIDAEDRLTGVRVLEARTPGVRDWVEKLTPHLIFASSTEDSAPRSGRALVLVRAEGTRRWTRTDFSFEPRESPWVQKLVLGVAGNEIPPVSVVALSRCRAIRPGFGAGEAHGRAAAPDCFQYEAQGTEWSPDTWKPPVPGSRLRRSEGLPHPHVLPSLPQ